MDNHDPNYSQYNITTVGELIDAAFGDPETNVVHHKMVQAILFLLANHVRLLQRKVYVPVDASELERTESTLVVSEVSLHTKAGKLDTKHDVKKQGSEKRDVSWSSESEKKDGRWKSDSEKTQVKKPEKRLSLTSQQEAAARTSWEPSKRSDSREEPNTTPTPMKSMDSLVVKYEKMLVVERVSTGEAKIRAARERSGIRRSDSSISIVTQEQFQELTALVRQVQRAFGTIHDKPQFPENMQLMQELRRGASLTDAMSALQLSARLEAAEKTIANLISIVTEMAIQFGIDLENDKKMNLLFEGLTPDEKSEFSSKRAKPRKNTQTEDKDKSMPSLISGKPILASKKNEITENETNLEEVKDPVHVQEMDAKLMQFYDTIIQDLKEKVELNTANTEHTYKLAKRLESRLDASQTLADKMAELQAAVTAYSNRINHLDKSLASQMTSYQEELTQMQHDLECGLETMADTLANTGGDATAVAELNTHFNDLQNAIDDSLVKQKELREMQRKLSEDFEKISGQIEVLRDTKSDRDEVEDALRDKAGIKDLNGMVDCLQFDAIRGDFQKQIVLAFEKFNSQELVWQKYIDDIEKTLYDKADLLQVMFLKDEVNMHLEKLNQKIKTLMEIVGEPSSAAVSQVIYRDANCISCSTPAHIELEVDNIPKLPAVRPPAIGAERELPKEDGDHGKCYPGYPIPHRIDPRARFCRRYCGGSHTVLNKTDRASPGLCVTTARDISEELGIDGRMYAVDTLKERQPCPPCAVYNIVDTNKKVSLEETEKIQARYSDMTPSDIIPNFTSIASGGSSMNAPIFDD